MKVLAQTGQATKPVGKRFIIEIWQTLLKPLLSRLEKTCSELGTPSDIAQAGCYTDGLGSTGNRQFLPCIGQVKPNRGDGYSHDRRDLAVRFANGSPFQALDLPACQIDQFREGNM